MVIYTALGVCSANVQRSATYEAVMKYGARERNVLPADLSIDSAGLNVEIILSNSVSEGRMALVLEAGLHYGLVRPELKPDVERLVQEVESGKNLPDETKGQLASLYSQVRPLVHGLLFCYRNLALEKAGVPNELLPSLYKPLSIEGTNRIILAMDESLLEGIRQRVADKPIVIMTYGQLVGQAPLNDDLRSGLEGAIRQTEYFMDTRNIALSEIFKLIPVE